MIPAGYVGKTGNIQHSEKTADQFEIISRIFMFIRKCNKKFVKEECSLYVRLHNF